MSKQSFRKIVIDGVKLKKPPEPLHRTKDRLADDYYRVNGYQAFRYGFDEGVKAVRALARRKKKKK